MRKLIVLSLGIILIAAACNKTGNEGANTPTPPPVSVTPSPEPTPTPPASSGPVEISITSTGFSPSTLTVKKGTKVTFKNSDSRLRWPASAPHPSHTDYPQLDPKAGIAAGASWDFTFDKVGTWRFHDHLFPTMFGSVTVTE